MNKHDPGGNIELLHHLLHIQSEEEHQREMEGERWFHELGDEAAFYIELADNGLFVSISRWYYQMSGDVQEAIAEALVSTMLAEKGT